MTDDSIRERHGMACRDKHDKSAHVEVWESERTIYLDVPLSAAVMTPYQARYLATKLYRLARRIRVRQDALAEVQS